MQLSYLGNNNFATNNPRAKLSIFGQTFQYKNDVEFNYLSIDTYYIRISWKIWKQQENYKSGKSTCFSISQKLSFLASFRQYSFEMNSDAWSFYSAK